MIIFKCFFKLRTPSGLSRLQDQYAQIRALVERRRADPWGLLVLSESLLNPALMAPETQNPGHQINLSPFDHYWVPAACLVLVVLCSTRQMNFLPFSWIYIPGEMRERSSHCKPVVLKLLFSSESPGKFVKIQLSGALPQNVWFSRYRRSENVQF